MQQYHPRAAPRPKSPLPPQHQDKPGLESKMHPRPQFEGAAYQAAGKLKGKVALVTGGDSGIGRAVALLYAREGANVAIVHLKAEASDARDTRATVRSADGECLLIAGDVRDSLFCKRAVRQTLKKFGRLDILVNNAAYQQSQPGLDNLTDTQIERTFRTNIFGYFYMARAALEHLPKGGAIINTGSITGLEGSKHLLDYSATKGAIHAFTKSLAQNLVERGIRVNCVAPGPIWTPLNVVDQSAKKVARHGAETPRRR